MLEFQTFHMGRPLNLWERCCLTSFVDHGYDVVLFGYERLDPPKGVRFAAAQEVVTEQERDEFFRVAPGRISQFSNIFRYELLRRHGGWWIDTDVVCLRSEMPGDDVVVGLETFDSVGNAIMRFPADHPLLAEAVAFCRANRESEIWAFTGPKLVTRLVAEHGLSSHPQAVFYPLDWAQIYDVLDPERCEQAAAVVSGSLVLHLWGHVVRDTGFQQGFLPPAGSFLGEAFRKHGGAGAAELDAYAYRNHLRVMRRMFELRRQNAALQSELDRAHQQLGLTQTK